MHSNRPMSSLDKSLSLLISVVEDCGSRRFSEISAEALLPAPTAYRMLTVLKRHGLVEQGQRGFWVAGRTLRKLGVRASRNEVAAAACRPVMRELSRRTGMATHLGVFEDGMVSYIAKVCSAEDKICTREGMQLEAYCSAIGKVLLAGLPKRTLQEYLASGPFYNLTKNTITDPRRIMDELSRINKDGFATDDCEADEQLRCLAVRIDHPFALALSISQQCPASGLADLMANLATLRKYAQDLPPLLSSLCLG